MHQPHHLTALEAAARLGTVRRRIADGSLPSVCVGRAVRNPAASLDLPVARPARCVHREAVAPDASDRDDSQVALIARWNASPWRRAFDRDARLHAVEPPRFLLEVVAARGSATARGGRAARNPGGGPRRRATVVSPPGVTGIVLAGGRSTRFFGDKLATEVGGRPLLHLAIDAVAGVVDEVVVVVGADAPEPALPSDVPVPVVVARDAVARQGPLAGLAAGLAAASHPLALLVGGDQPTLQPALLRELLRWLTPAAGGPPLDVVGLEEDGRLRPLPVAVRVGTAGPAAEIALAGGTGSLVGLFGGLRAGALRQEQWRELDPAGDSLRDVDTRDDLPST